MKPVDLSGVRPAQPKGEKHSSKTPKLPKESIKECKRCYSVDNLAIRHGETDLNDLKPVKVKKRTPQFS